MTKKEWQIQQALSDEEMLRVEQGIQINEGKITLIYPTPEWRKKDPNWTIKITTKR